MQFGPQNYFLTLNFLKPLRLPPQLPRRFLHFGPSAICNRGPYFRQLCVKDGASSAWGAAPRFERVAPCGAPYRMGYSPCPKTHHTSHANAQEVCISDRLYLRNGFPTTLAHFPPCLCLFKEGQTTPLPPSSNWPEISLKFISSQLWLTAQSFW